MIMYRGIIYKYTSPSNKVYIGLTIDEKSRRNAFLNINKMYAGGKIEAARRKYGPENFNYEILEDIQSNNKKDLLKSLNTLEVKYIKKYDSYKYGYNSTPGGHFLYIYTELDKDKISKSKSTPVILYSLDGYYIDLWETVRKASAELNINKDSIHKCCRGAYIHGGDFIWRYATKEFPLYIEGLTQKKIDSINNSKDSKNTTNGRTFKKVLLYDLNGNFIREFSSLIEAANSVGLRTTTCITQSCKNLGMSKGYLWRYYLKDYPLYIEVNLSSHSLITNKENFYIYLFDLNGNLLSTWRSYKEACDALNINRTGIYLCCTGKLKTYKNFVWKYEL